MYRVGTAPAPHGGERATPGPIVWLGSARPLALIVSDPDSSINRGDSVSLNARNTGVGGELFGADLDWSFFPDSAELYPRGRRFGAGGSSD